MYELEKLTMKEEEPKKVKIYLIPNVFYFGVPKNNKPKYSGKVIPVQRSGIGVRRSQWN